MDRLDFAHSIVRLTLEECERSPDATEDDLAFAARVLVQLLPRTGEPSMEKHTPALLRIVQRLPATRRPGNLRHVLAPILTDADLRRVVEELDAMTRAARQARFH